MDRDLFRSGYSLAKKSGLRSVSAAYLSARPPLHERVASSRGLYGRGAIIGWARSTGELEVQRRFRMFTALLFLTILAGLVLVVGICRALNSARTSVIEVQPRYRS